MGPQYASLGNRLLLDENLPWRVAESLQVLELGVYYVGDIKGNPPSPTRGSTDEVVLAHAMKCSQTIVTRNLDMILLCIQNLQNVIWIDQRGRDLRREELVLLIFKNIRDWDELLTTAVRPVCLRAMRTTTKTLDIDEAGHLIDRRMARISETRAKSLASRQRSHQSGGLFAA